MDDIKHGSFMIADAALKPVGGWTKRSLDLTIAVLALLVLLPLFVSVALLVKLSDRGPVFFRHRRLGCSGRSFDCLKFRTMVKDGDAVLKEHFAKHPEAAAEWLATRKLKNDPRVTPLGAVLRKTSVDELPQLVNVLLGDMSIVGPRPIVIGEVSAYGPKIEDYLSARPGLTGAWQVSGRSDVSYDTRVQLDCSYVRDWSLRQDIGIIIRTVPAVIRQRGSY